MSQAGQVGQGGQSEHSELSEQSGKAGRSGPADEGGGRHHPAMDAFCRFVDRANETIGWLLGPMIVFVSAAIVYEVLSRGIFNQATTWVNESVIYGSSAVYLLVGGYALLHRRHVRIDLLLGALSPRAVHVLDLIALPFLVVYALALVIAGGELAWTSFMQSEGTGSPWNPRIWPVKACIPLAGLLLLLQALANLLRDLGFAPAKGPVRTEDQER